MTKKEHLQVEDLWDNPQRTAAAKGGKLLVQVISAKGLMAMDRNGLSDPFLRVEAAGHVRHRTEVHKKTLEPVFSVKEICFLTCPEHMRPEDELVLQIRDHDKIGKNEFMGEVRIPRCVEKYSAPGMVDVVHDCVVDLMPKQSSKKKSKKMSGSLHFRIYFSNQTESLPVEPPVSLFFYKELASKFKTGDLLLFDSFGLFPSLNKIFSNTPYGDVGMIVKMPNKWTNEEDFYLVQVSRNVDKAVDAFKEDRKANGLVIFRLFERIHQSHAARIFYAPIRHAITSAEQDALEEYLVGLHTAPNHEALNQPFGMPPSGHAFYELSHSEQLEGKSLAKYTHISELFAPAVFQAALSRVSADRQFFTGKTSDSASTSASSAHGDRDKHKDKRGDHAKPTPLFPCSLLAKGFLWEMPAGEAPVLIRCYGENVERHAKGLKPQTLGGSLPIFTVPAAATKPVVQISEPPKLWKEPSVRTGLHRSRFTSTRYAQLPKIRDVPFTPPPGYADAPPVYVDSPPSYAETAPVGHVIVAPVQYPGAGFIQTGGHEGAFAQMGAGKLRKRTTGAEAHYYGQMLKEVPAAAAFAPEFYSSSKIIVGGVSHLGHSGHVASAVTEEHDHEIVLEDLTHGLDPATTCVMDLKMGSCVGPDLDAVKAARSAAKDAQTTTATLGFRLTGMKAVHFNNVVHYRKEKDGSNQLSGEQDMHRWLQTFFGGAGNINSDVVEAFLARLENLHRWMSKQTDIQYRSSSLLFVYDSHKGLSGGIRLKMIDFVHTFKGHGVVDAHYVRGLETLMLILKSFVSASQDSPAPF